MNTMIGREFAGVIGSPSYIQTRSRRPGGQHELATWPSWPLTNVRMSPFPTPLVVSVPSESEALASERTERDLPPFTLTAARRSGVLGFCVTNGGCCDGNGRLHQAPTGD